MKRSEYRKEWQKNFTINNPEKIILRAAKRRAKDKGISFDLETKDIFIPKVCPIFGIPLFFSRMGKKGPRENTPTLDRVDPAKGYTKDNICIISGKANTLKSWATEEDLELLLNYIRVHRKYAGRN